MSHAARRSTVRRGTPATVPPALLEVRPSVTIFSVDRGWYRGRWHFSFDDYYDPANTRLGALRVFNHEILAPGAATPMHPHRDIEGVTYVIAGRFSHADSLGSEGTLLPGGVQRMTLGAGAWHSECNHSRTSAVQFIHMWIMPGTLGLLPDVEQRQFAAAERRNRLLRILKPAGAPGEGVSVYQDVSAHVARLDTGVEVGYSFPRGRGGYCYVISGQLSLNGHRLAAGDAAKILSPGSIRLRADQTGELILVDTPLQLPPGAAI